MIMTMIMIVIIIIIIISICVLGHAASASAYPTAGCESGAFGAFRRCKGPRQREEGWAKDAVNGVWSRHPTKELPQRLPNHQLARPTTAAVFERDVRAGECPRRNSGCFEAQQC